jgi:hypothetical protein
MLQRRAPLAAILLLAVGFLRQKLMHRTITTATNERQLIKKAIVVIQRKNFNFFEVLELKSFSTVLSDKPNAFL